MTLTDSIYSVLTYRTAQRNQKQEGPTFLRGTERPPERLARG